MGDFSYTVFYEMVDFSKFIPFSKVDAAKREVSGIVTAELPDKDREVCDYAKSKPFYMEWSEGFKKSTDGASLGNLREMHQLSAVGKALDIQFDDTDKEITMTFKVVDDEAWKKVEERVYTGFSQGGRKVGEQVPDPVYKGCVRYTANPIEVSLVDNPCLAAARFAYVKADGTIELRKFLKIEPPDTERIVALEQQVNLLKAAAATPITAVAAPAAAIEPVKAVTKRVAGKELEASSFAYVGDIQKTETWQYPVQDAANVRRSIAKMALASEAEKAKVRSKVIAAAKKLNIDVANEETKIAAFFSTMRKAARVHVNKNFEGIASPRLQALDSDLGKLTNGLNKGMWEISRLACSVEDIACLLFSVCCEQEYELDEDSALPEMLAENVAAITATLIAMVDEETRELLAQVNARVA